MVELKKRKNIKKISGKMQHEKRRKPLKILDSRLYMWYFEIKEKCVEKKEKNKC